MRWWYLSVMIKGVVLFVMGRGMEGVGEEVKKCLFDMVEGLFYFLSVGNTRFFYLIYRRRTSSTLILRGIKSTRGVVFWKNGSLVVGC